MKHLMRQLDSEDPDWQGKTVFLLDGARYHTSEDMREYFRNLQVQVMFSGPYSYAAAPIEMVFGALKRGELNPERRSTGKKYVPSFLLLILLIFLLLAQEFGGVRGPDHRAAGQDAQEHVRPVLAPFHAGPLQVPLLRAHLSRSPS